jgi:hypothetical protein
MPLPEPVRYRNKGTQSSTGMPDAGIPMPVASASMLVPSYGNKQ